MVPWQLVGFLISLIARKVQRKKKKKISGIVALCGAGRALRCCQLELLFVCSCYTLESSVSGQVLLCWLFSVQPTSTTPSGRFRVNIREQKEWLGSGTAGQGAVGSPSMQALRAVGMWHLGVRLVGMAGWAGVGLGITEVFPSLGCVMILWHCGLLGSESSCHCCAGRAVVQQEGFLLHVLAPLMQHIGLHSAAHGL